MQSSDGDDLMENESENVLGMPYAAASRRVVKKLIDIGLLQQSRRHDAKAIERALVVLRQRSEQFFSQ